MMNCVLCASPRACKKFSVIDTDTIMRCSACGLEFMWPQADAAYRDQLYSRDYYQSWGDIRTNTALRAMKRKTADFYLNAISRYKKSGALLDVGCAAGYLLESARDRGFLPYGIEYSNYSATVAQEKFGSDAVRIGTIETSNFPGHSFDVITMIDLLEHVPDPVGTLSRAKEMLKPGGIIVIVTPDTDALTNVIMGKRWTHYKKEHLYYFNKQSMQALSSRTGFSMMHYGHGLKYITLEYVCNQYHIYKHRVLTPVTAVFNRVLPRTILTAPIPFRMGESLIVLSAL
ncbi:MAG: class I SAM-dependent methyltransferase [Endomicrobiales bacterium]